MYGFMSLSIKLAFPKYKLAFVFGLSNILLSRLFLSMAQFSPPLFIANYVLSTGEDLIKSAIGDIDMSGISAQIGDFLKIFDIMKIDRVEASINLSPFPTRLLSGTTIPTGIYFMMKDVELLFMYKFDLILLNLDLFTLEPKLDVHMFLPKNKFMIGSFYIQMEGADPSIQKALSRILKKKDAEAARLIEKERLHDEKQRAKEMEELKNSDGAGGSATLGRKKSGTRALGAAQHLGDLAKLGTGGWIPGISRNTLSDAGSVCKESVCHSCVRVSEGTRLIVQCAEEQEVLDFQDAAWGVDAEQPPWNFDDMPAQCSLDMLDIKTGRMTVAAERVQLLETLKVGRCRLTLSNPR